MDNKYRKYGSKVSKTLLTRNSQPLKTSSLMSDIVRLSKYDESMENARKFWFSLLIKDILFVVPTVSKLTIAPHQTVDMLHTVLQPQPSVNMQIAGTNKFTYALK